ETGLRLAVARCDVTAGAISRAGGCGPWQGRDVVVPASAAGTTDCAVLLQLLRVLGGLVLQRLAGREARLQRRRLGLEGGRLTGEGVGTLARLGGRLVAHLQTAEVAQRHAARGVLFGVLQREAGDDRPQGIEELARVPAAEFVIPLLAERLVQGGGIRL